MAPGATPLTVITGFSASMLMPLTVVLAELPAASTAVPVTDWLAPFVVSPWSAGQVAIPESESPQVKCTVTGPLYQPFAFAAVVGAPLVVGAGFSSLTVTASVPRLPARAVAWAFTTWPAAVV